MWDHLLVASSPHCSEVLSHGYSVLLSLISFAQDHWPVAGHFLSLGQTPASRLALRLDDTETVPAGGDPLSSNHVCIRGQRFSRGNPAGLALV